MTAPAWLALAHQEMGTEEVEGVSANPRIMEYFAATGGTWVKDDGTPWCGAFVGYVMATSGHKLSAEPLRARSWLTWGKPLDKPIPGCVVVLKRGNDPQQGHVGLYVQPGKDGTLYILGGNQGDAVTIAKFRETGVLGYRWPDDVKAEPPKPEGSRIVSEADAVKLAGGASAAGGIATGVVAPPTIPSPPSLPQVGEWHGFATNIQSFGLFCIESWPWVAAAIGVYLVLSGQAIKWFRKQDAATGKTWGDF